MPVSSAPIERGTIVIRNGLIVAIGTDVTASADAHVVDGTGLTVYLVHDATRSHERHKRGAPRPGTFRMYLSQMTVPTEAQARAWAALWRAAGPALARVRAAELNAIDLVRVADELEEALLVRVGAEAPSVTSGLVEQQRLFARERARGR